jgi:hypothetical protein
MIYNFANYIFGFYLFFHIYDHGSLSPRSSDLSVYPTHGSPHTGRLKEVLLYFIILL